MFKKVIAGLQKAAKYAMIAMVIKETIDACVQSMEKHGLSN